MPPTSDVSDKDGEVSPGGWKKAQINFGHMGHARYQFNDISDIVVHFTKLIIYFLEKIQ